MKRLFLSAAFVAALPLTPTAQTPPTQPRAPVPDYDAGGLPRTPTYHAMEGQPVDSRAPEKKTDTRQFPQQTRAPYHHAADFKVTVLSNELRAGWASVVLPSGRILVSEHLPGALRLLDHGKLSEPLVGLEGLGIATASMILMDVQPDPAYAANHTIYFTYCEYLDKTVYNTAIARAVVDEDAHALRDVKTLLTTVPYFPNDQTQNAGGKTGGRIAVGPDGFLYVTIGDRDNAGTRPWGVAQVLDTHLGKILRITKDGAPAPGNPFIGRKGALPEIWVYGLRSPEGIAFAPDGSLWETEHGPRGGDELNRIEKGKNYGWPIITHGVDYSAKVIGDNLVAKEGMEQPVYYWSPSTAPSGLAFYTGKSKAWAGSIFVPMLNGRHLARLKLVDGKVVEEEAMLTDLKTRIRDVRMGADNAIYVFTDPTPGALTEKSAATGQLLKITPNR
ncbi:MAG TPA: PQQ-dependent sugar dehydrogenase [Rhizomicrobium sp.]